MTEFKNCAMGAVVEDETVFPDMIYGYYKYNV
jgi:hypothetical protein